MSGHSSSQHSEKVRSKANESSAYELLGPTRVRVHGDPPLPLSDLLERMETHKLGTWFGDCCALAHGCIDRGREPGERERRYEDTGPIYADAPHAVRFFGNFDTYSHAFTLDTDDPEVIEVLMDAIAANRERFA